MGDFVWTERALGWMRDAARESGYYTALAARIAPRLWADARVLDLGCGTGALAVALSPYVKSVTALDSSGLALSALDVRPENVFPLEADAFSYAPDKAFDAMLLCYFARPAELPRLSRLCRGRVILLCDAARSESFEAVLKADGIPFDRECFSLPFSQPLRSYEDARAYAAYYQRPMAKPTEDPVFPYRDTITRHMALISYK